MEAERKKNAEGRNALLFIDAVIHLVLILLVTVISFELSSLEAL